MRAVVDSSTLISLAWAGHLDLLHHTPLEFIVLTSVYEETVVHGLDAGHADAAAIETALSAFDRVEGAAQTTVDLQVVATAAEVGAVVTNDAVLGRRAGNLGATWLRTADLVVLAHRTSSIDDTTARAVLAALHDAGRITRALLDAYLEELP